MGLNCTKIQDYKKKEKNEIVKRTIVPYPPIKQKNIQEIHKGIHSNNINSPQLLQGRNIEFDNRFNFSPTIKINQPVIQNIQQYVIHPNSNNRAIINSPILRFPDFNSPYMINQNDSPHYTVEPSPIMHSNYLKLNMNSSKLDNSQFLSYKNVNFGCYIIIPFWNFSQEKEKYNIFEKFKMELEAQKVKPIVVELVFQNNPFVVTSPFNPFDIQLKSNSIIYLYENLKD